MKSKLNNIEIDVLLNLVYEEIKASTEMGNDTELLWSIEDKLARQFYNNQRRKK